MNIIEGNIFTTKQQTIVNTVNCFGIMGAGLALECKYRYPEMFKRYQILCENKQLNIGQLYLYKSNQKWILNFPTKNHWKYPTKVEFLEKGLSKFVCTYKNKGIKSVAFPLLGAQNGGLTKEQSLILLRKHLKNIDIPVEIYQYNDHAPDDIFDTFKNAFLTQDKSTLQKHTDLKSNKIIKLKEILENENLKNMGHLSRVKGVGEATMSKCYNYAMSDKINNIQTNLF